MRIVSANREELQTYLIALLHLFRFIATKPLDVKETASLEELLYFYKNTSRDKPFAFEVEKKAISRPFIMSLYSIFENRIGTSRKMTFVAVKDGIAIQALRQDGATLIVQYVNISTVLDLDQVRMAMDLKKFDYKVKSTIVEPKAPPLRVIPTKPHTNASPIIKTVAKAVKEPKVTNVTVTPVPQPIIVPAIKEEEVKNEPVVIVKEPTPKVVKEKPVKVIKEVKQPIVKVNTPEIPPNDLRSYKIDCFVDTHKVFSGKDAWVVVIYPRTTSYMYTMFTLTGDEAEIAQTSYDKLMLLAKDNLVWYGIGTPIEAMQKATRKFDTYKRIMDAKANRQIAWTDLIGSSKSEDSVTS